MSHSLDQLLRDAADAEGGARQMRAAARLMSLLERDPQRLPELFRHRPIDEWSQPRIVIGITGAPGSGKSTLTDQLVAEYRRRFPERRVGVIAVDPSSPYTGGSVLGDRVRMMRHATDPHVFIRSLATRGHLGGLSLGVKGVLRVLGLIGCDVVFVETVGVGQSEVEVAGVADLVMVVLAPGQGDSIQMLKAGLMEIGDLIVVNKADREGANQLHRQLLSALSISRDAAWDSTAPTTDADLEDAVMARRRPEKPDVYLVSATSRTGIEELFEGIERRAEASRTRWMRLRGEAIRDEVREAVFEAARHRLAAALGGNGEAEDRLQQVLDGRSTVDDLTQELLERASAEPAQRNDSKATKNDDRP